MQKTVFTQTGAKIQEDLNFNEGLVPYFSTSSTYAVGDIVRYEDKIYKCHTAVVTAGAWTGTANWAEKKITEVIDEAILGPLNASY